MGLRGRQVGVGGCTNRDSGVTRGRLPLLLGSACVAALLLGSGTSPALAVCARAPAAGMTAASATRAAAAMFVDLGATTMGGSGWRRAIHGGTFFLRQNNAA